MRSGLVSKNVTKNALHLADHEDLQPIMRSALILLILSGSGIVIFAWCLSSKKQKKHFPVTIWPVTLCIQVLDSMVDMKGKTLRWRGALRSNS